MTAETERARRLKIWIQELEDFRVATLKVAHRAQEMMDEAREEIKAQEAVR